MLLTKKITVKINNRNKKHYIKKGYEIDNKYIKVNVFDVSNKYKTFVDVRCDKCKNNFNITLDAYYKNIKKHNFYSCQKCSYDKSKITYKEKYGVEHPLKSDISKNKMKKTNLERYGVENTFQHEKFKNKIRKTNLSKYGVDNPMKNKNIMKKAITTKRKKYGNKFEKCLEKTNRTMLDKYGYKFALMNPIICKCVMEKNRLKRNIKLKEKIKNLISVDDNIKEFSIYCDSCDNIFNISYGLYKNRKKSNTILCTICNQIGSSKSGYEIQLQNFIKEQNIDITINKRDIIFPLELDVYLPELKLAFEFNGLYWHNELYKENNYHLNKTELCEEKGIQLIHIWEDNWINKQEIVKSMILNKLDKTVNKIYGRKTIIKEISDNKIVKEFLIENHLQGSVGSKVKLGLYYDNELVSLMTLGKRRVAMGKKKSGEGEYELLRYCNKLNTNVLGGASKLFKYFVSNYKPKEITTYADRSHSNGKLYEQLGFEFISKTQPNYYYIVDGIRNHRFNFRKDKLIKEGFDPNKTEHQIMLDRNIFRIYDSGNLKYQINFYFS